MKKILFYHPQPIVENPVKGSELRPKKMKEAFQNLHYDVDLIVGDSTARKIAMESVKKSIRDGTSYEFLYAESSNMPIPISDSHHFPLHPIQDYSFFRFLNKNSIPTGLFYRDIFWQVQGLKKNMPLHKYIIKQWFHWLEWYGMKKTINHLFLPTLALKKFLPSEWPEADLSALYPGCNSKLQVANFSEIGSQPDNKLHLFYVGGVKPPLYDLTPMMEMVSETKGVHLKLCCRKKEWRENREYYRQFDFSNIDIVHGGSDEITEYYNWADISLCIWPKTGYINVTIPIKVIETIGFEVPILILEGSESAQFVKREDAGWTVRNLREAKILLQDLQKNPEKLKAKADKVRAIKPRHSWEARAKQAAATLESLNT